MTHAEHHTAKSGSPILLGVNFRNAPLALREAMSFSPTETKELLEAVSRDRPVAEAAILSTCNRTEFYLADSDAAPDEPWCEWLTGWRPPEVIADFKSHAYRKTGHHAATHLFRVASGLDSSVLGDVQIQGQVKEAMRMSSRAGVLKAHLNQIMTQAIRTGRRARTDTEISVGSPSVGSAVARIIGTRLMGSGVDQPKIVIVGGGKAGQTIAQNVTGRWADVTLVNRTASRAESLGRRLGVQWAPWGELAALIRSADVLVTATAAAEPIVTRPMFEGGKKRTRPLLVIDPSVPRNVEDSDSVELVDIDSVKDQQGVHLAAREKSRDAVEEIVMMEGEQWLQWSARRPVEELIRRLYATAEKMTPDVANRIRDASTQAQAEQLTETSFRDLIQDHIRDLRSLVVSSHPADHDHHDSKSNDPDG